jgi:threonine dehydratase
VERAFSLADLEAAAGRVHEVLPPTPQYEWPLLSRRAGTETWVKHENHTPVGAFKVRGGLVLFEELRADPAARRGVIAATRGNHGQSVAFAAARAGLPAVILVPRGNSEEKNAAMRALGAEVVEHGGDFQAALERARSLADERGLLFVPSFAPALVRGVASYALELFRGAPPLDRVYVPIGLGSGICGVLAARDALGLATEVVGVCSAGAPSYALSFAAREPVATERAETMADGLACRVPVEEALERIFAGAADVVTVTDAEIRAAMRALFSDTHNVAEGAGAAALAAALKERAANAGRRIGLVLSGGNVDRKLFAEVLAGGEES